MRNYSVINPQFWIGETGPEICKKGPEAVVIALYLLTCPLSNMIGLYYIPLQIISEETKVPPEGVLEALRRVEKTGFAQYDFAKSTVWVPEMAKIQIAESLKKGDNRIEGVKNLLKQYAKSTFYVPFIEKYRKAFHLTGSPFRVPLQGASGTPSKPGPGTETRNRDQEQDTCENFNSPAVAGTPKSRKPTGTGKSSSPGKQNKQKIDTKQEIVSWMKKTAQEKGKRWKYTKPNSKDWKSNQGPTLAMEEEIRGREREDGPDFLRRLWLEFLDTPESDCRYPFREFLDGIYQKRHSKLAERRSLAGRAKEKALADKEKKGGVPWD